jgi:hypothetical protein
MRQLERPTHRQVVFGKYGQTPEAGLFGSVKIMAVG